MPYALKFAAGAITGELVSCYAVDPTISRVAGALFGNSVNAISGRKLLYYGSGHLPHVQLSQLQEKTDSLLGLPQHPATALHRRYHYSPGGEVQRIVDKQRGITDFHYDANGQLRSRQPNHPQLHTEDFSYDPAGNLCGSGSWQFDKIQNNRLIAFKDLRFTYDDWGNLSEKSSANGAMQRFTYDCENRLIHAQTWHGATLHSEARYHYDALGRRIAKAVMQSGQTQETTFLWQGLRLLQEQQPQRHSTYVYETDSYVPLARIDTDPGLPEREARLYYFHTDQIGTPQEMSDAQGHVVWRAYYKAWGGLEALSPNTVEQNLRFQGQYHDRESGLYYNTFRYYDPAVGRFTTQDPIGLAGGDNLYRYAPNALGWVDPWGWECWSTARKNFWKNEIKVNASNYSAANAQRMAKGSAPRIQVEVLKNGRRIIKDVSMELHHTNIPQRVGGAGVHNSSNLTALTPWAHEAIDPFRKTGKTLIKIIKDTSTW
ncbi:RHS repeat domain-containing protein [Pseudomonas sp. LD120]|uniref:RHS repeat domain-containing protein n=1 Tax=Pseudomonas sp. LD120 TaxID=485751 RepID=UPI001359376A|nr:RHS repeat-associated core domain-containing protein [Pseudomonas sp. LD120]KAF0867289.1 type IV secretion protein Rhs [Pseudomonas sp. LD120]